MNWTRRFDDPVPMPDGSTIRTIGEAAEYATSLPPKVGKTAPWQIAARVLNEAAEHGGPFVFMARLVFCKAVFGETPPTIGNAEGKKGPIGASGSWRGIVEPARSLCSHGKSFGTNRRICT